MNAIFFSIWIDGRIMGPPAIQKALDQIDAVHENVRTHSKDLVFCRTAAQVREAHKNGKIAALNSTGVHANLTEADASRPSKPPKIQK